MNWHRIELTVTVRIIVVRSHVFSRNLGSSGLEFGLVYHVPVIVFLMFAKQNGKIVAGRKSED